MKKRYLVLFIAVLVLIIGLLGYGYWLDKNKPEVVDIQSQRVYEPVQIKLAIQDFTKPDITFEFDNSITVLEYLEFINKSDQRLNLITEEYGEMGILVIQLGDNVNGQDNKYWQYYVNSEMPMVSADNYMLKDGDFLEWKFQESKF